MKVLILNSLYYPNIIGGAEKSVQIIAEKLKESGISPIVVTVSDKERIDYINEIKVYYIHYSNIYWSYYSKIKKVVLKLCWHFFSLYNFTMLRKIKIIIEKEKPDIAHTNNLSEFSVGIWRVFKRSNIPVMHTLRDYSLLCPRATLFKGGSVCKKKNFICRLILSFKRLFSKYVDMVTGNSNFILEEHIKSGFFKNSQRCVIFNSLNSEGIIQNKKIVKDDLRFGYIGILSYHKGIELLLKVFNNINEDNLHVFGKGITIEYEAYLRSKYISNKIKFHGFVQTKEAFKVIDVLIVPSLWNDPLPRVIYEAYSYGVPVIGSDRGGIPEVIDEEKTGYIFNPDFEEQLKEKINIFRNNHEIIKNMSLSCIAKARDFLPTRVVQEYINNYKKLS